MAVDLTLAGAVYGSIATSELELCNVATMIGGAVPGSSIKHTLMLGTTTAAIPTIALVTAQNRRISFGTDVLGCVIRLRLDAIGLSGTNAAKVASFQLTLFALKSGSTLSLITNSQVDTLINQAGAWNVLPTLTNGAIATLDLTVTGDAGTTVAWAGMAEITYLRV